MIAFALVEQEELDIKRLLGRLIERQRSFDIADSQNPVVEFQSSEFQSSDGTGTLGKQGLIKDRTRVHLIFAEGHKSNKTATYGFSFP
jgi:hypothetical protein